jgi:uncharacterized protein DUF1707
MTAETQMSTPLSAPPSPLRASDAEREATVARLHQALAEGRLDLAETEERVTAAYAARHRDELPPLLADLPSSMPAPGDAPQWDELWVSTVWRARSALLGPQERPGPGQCRSAAWLVVLAVVWVALCALVGAAVVS